MVAVAAQKFIPAESPQRIIFIFSFFSHHERTLEYRSVEFAAFRLYQLQLSGLAVHKSRIHNHIVEKIPGIVIAQGTVSGLVHAVERIEISSVLDFRKFFLSSQYLCNALVFRIVVHIAHNDDFN